MKNKTFKILLTTIGVIAPLTIATPFIVSCSNTKKLNLNQYNSLITNEYQFNLKLTDQMNKWAQTKGKDVLCTIYNKQPYAYSDFKFTTNKNLQDLEFAIRVLTSQNIWDFFNIELFNNEYQDGDIYKLTLKDSVEYYFRTGNKTTIKKIEQGYIPQVELYCLKVK